MDLTKTYGVIVAVESYPGLGRGWKLNHAVAQSLEFTRWLVAERGIPASNIRVFLSGGDPTPFRSLGIPEAAIAKASSAELNPFLTQIGEEWSSGEVLFLYCAGHGFLSRDGDRRLILSDATRALKTNLDLTQLRFQLASQSAGRLRTQFCFIDACARRFEQLQSRNDLPAGGLSPARDSLAGVQQNFYLAASDGEYTTDGSFGKELLTLLRQLPSEEWPPPNRLLRDRFEAHFDQLLAQRPFHMQPVWLEYRAVGNESQIGAMPTLPDIHDLSWRAGLPLRRLRTLTQWAAQCKSLQERRQRDAVYDRLGATSPLNRPTQSRSNLHLDLMRLIGGVVEQDRLDDLVDMVILSDLNSDAALQFSHVAKTVADLKSVWPLVAGIALPLARLSVLFKLSTRTIVARPVPSSLPEILDVLLDLRPPREPLIEFLARVARERPGDPRCQELHRYLETRADWTDTLSRVNERLDEERRSVRHLLVEVGGDAHVQYIERAWHWRDGYATPVDYPELPRSLAEGILALSNELDSEPGTMCVELLMPGELFHLDRGYLTCESAGQKLDIERLYAVSLRLCDRMAFARIWGYQNGLWRKNARTIKQRLQIKRGGVYWVRTDCDPHDLRWRFENDQSGEVCGIPFPSDCERRKDLLSLICNAGLPYACWPRLAATDFAGAQQPFDRIVISESFELVPYAKWREGDDALADVLLLWDDPERDPYYKMTDLPVRN